LGDKSWQQFKEFEKEREKEKEEGGWGEVKSSKK
jgi:hypothetical protein